MLANLILPFRSLASRLLDLAFPPVCEACGRLLVEGETLVCTHCSILIQQAENHEGNSLEQKFWGRANVIRAVSYSPFLEGAVIQSLIHALKYKNRKNIGAFLGRKLADILLQEQIGQNIDIIVPVPLHWKKKKRRGYNQSEQIARGISDGLNLHRHGRNPVFVETSCIRRHVNTETQTTKNGEERWMNVQDIFQLKKTGSLIGKHVLVVDDVVTTGATLISLLEVLNCIEGIHLYVAAATSVLPASPNVPDMSR